jgi:hypothetical protein
MLATMNPYCEVRCGVQTQHSKPCMNGGPTPAFDWKTVTSCNPHSVITLLAMNSGSISKTLIGSIEIPIKDLTHGGIVEEWFPLTFEKKPAGEVHLRMQLVPKDPDLAARLAQGLVRAQTLAQGEPDAATEGAGSVSKAVVPSSFAATLLASLCLRVPLLILSPPSSCRPAALPSPCLQLPPRHPHRHRQLLLAAEGEGLSSFRFHLRGGRQLLRRLLQQPQQQLLVLHRGVAAGATPSSSSSPLRVTCLPPPLRPLQAAPMASPPSCSLSHRPAARTGTSSSSTSSSSHRRGPSPSVPTLAQPRPTMPRRSSPPTRLPLTHWEEGGTTPPPCPHTWRLRLLPAPPTATAATACPRDTPWTRQEEGGEGVVAATGCSSSPGTSPLQEGVTPTGEGAGRTLGEPSPPTTWAAAAAATARALTTAQEVSCVRAWDLGTSSVACCCCPVCVVCRRPDPGPYVPQPRQDVLREGRGRGEAVARLQCC